MTEFSEFSFDNSGETFYHMMNNMIEGVQIISKEWKYLYVNDSIVNQAKYAREEMIGYTMMEKYPGIEHSYMFEQLKRSMYEGVSLQIENEFIYPDQSKGWFELRIHPIKVGLFILSLDITDRKKNEEEVKVQKKFAEIVLNNIPADIAVFDKEHRYLLLNPEAIKDAELRSWMIGKTDFDYVKMRGLDDSIAQKRKDKFNEAKDTKTDVEWVDIHYSKEGNIKHILRKLHPVIENQDVKYIIGYGIDISQKKEQEDQLLQIAELNRKIINSSNEVFYVVKITDSESLNNPLVYVSDKAIDFYGYSAEYLIKRPYVWFLSIHKHDRHFVIESTKQLFINKQPVSRIYRILNSITGKYLWIYDSVTPILDDYGEIIEVYGSIKNITELKNAEMSIALAAAEAEEKERGRVARELHDGISQNLVGLSMYINLLDDVVNMDAKEYNETLGLIKDLIKQTMDETRRVSHDLMPQDFNKFGLVQVLENLITKLNKVDVIQYNLSVQHIPQQINSLISINLYRITQEFIRNSQKYSRAKMVDITLSFVNNLLLLSLKDDGIGFDMDEKNAGGIGLVNMVTRIESINGSYNFKTSRGEGVSLTIKIPL